MDSEEKIENKKEKKRFSVIARLKSTNHAWRGVGIVLSTTHNFWVHIFFAFLAVVLGFLLRISHVEWMIMAITIGIVFMAEAFNTAMEIDIDLTSPNYHPYAKDTKDVAAGAVLISALLAVVVGILIFAPKIFEIINIML